MHRVLSPTDPNLFLEISDHSAPHTHSETRSQYTALTGLELTKATMLAQDTERSACLCLLSAETKGLHHPLCLVKVCPLAFSGFL